MIPTDLSPHQRSMLIGIRGIIAFWITLKHMFFNAPYDLGFTSREGLGLLEPMLIFSFLGVDLFFILSGLLLYRRYHEYFEQKTRSKDIDLFFLHRLARIYPLHLVTLGLIGLYHLIDIPHPLTSGRELENFGYWKLTGLLNLLLMNGWGIVAQASWNEPAWTISIFFMLYVLFPNLVVALKHTAKSLGGLLISIYMLIIFYAVARYAIAETGEVLSHSDGTGAIMRGLVFFTIGCLLARMQQRHDLSHWKWPIIMPALLLSSIALMWLWFYSGVQFDVVVFHLLYPMGILGLLYSHDRFSVRLCTNRIALALGRVSYSIYLLHYPICLAISAFLGEWLRHLATGHALIDLWMNIAAIGVIYLCSIAAYHFIEAPIYRWIKQRFPLTLSLEKTPPK